MDHLRFKKHYKLILIAALAILIFLIAASVTFGVANISIIDSYKIMMSRLPLIGSFISTKGINEAYIQIILYIRLPRILLGVFVGMGLSAVGAVYQAIFKNPMADPYVLGVSSGSALGAALAIFLGLDTTIMAVSGTTLFAFSFAILTTFIVYSIASVGHKVSTANLLLTGVAVSFFMSSIISVIMIIDRNQIDKIVFWTMGSLASATWQQVVFLAILCSALIMCILFFARDLNVILVDEEAAKTMSVDNEKVKKIMLILCSLMVASVVAVSGIIGFVGLIIPHAVRIFSGSDNRRLIPLTAVAGAAFMIMSDTIARTILAPSEIPVGAITALFGAPYFLFLLSKNKKKVF
ncbi:MAG: iron ABC transporter permease [Bacillota bacterium]|nr:iron ABC transporter permease [Bacillota bacterium]